MPLLTCKDFVPLAFCVASHERIAGIPAGMASSNHTVSVEGTVGCEAIGVAQFDPAFPKTSNHASPSTREITRPVRLVFSIPNWLAGTSIRTQPPPAGSAPIDT